MIHIEGVKSLGEGSGVGVLDRLNLAEASAKFIDEGHLNPAGVFT